MASMTVAWHSLSVLLPVRYARQRRLRLVFGMLKPRSGQTRQEGYDNADRAGLFDRDDDVDEAAGLARCSRGHPQLLWESVLRQLLGYFEVPLGPQTGVPT